MERVAQRLRSSFRSRYSSFFCLLYFNTGSAVKTLIILLAVPFSAIGAVWFLYLLHYNMSIAVWVGLIALLGVDAETAVFMLLYLDLAYHEAMQNGGIRTVGRFAGSDCEWRGQEASAEGDDGIVHAVRSAADHVVVGKRAPM